MLNRVTTMLIAMELVVVLLWLPHVAWTRGKAVGAVIVVGSMLLLIVARVQLGRSFSVRARAMRLVTTGVYARVRDPIYWSGVLLLGGLALLLASWWPAALLLLVVPMQRARARREARVLEERFGEEYVRYRGVTWF